MCLEYFTLLTSLSSYIYISRSPTATVFLQRDAPNEASHRSCSIFTAETFMFLSKINEKAIKMTHKKLQQKILPQSPDR